MKKGVLVGLFLGVFLIASVFAAWVATPSSEVGGDIRVKISDTFYSLQNAIDSGSITGNAVVTPEVWIDSDHPQWHDAEEVKVIIEGEEYSLQNAIDSGLIGGGMGGWDVGEWSECSDACGGTRTRTVTCVLSEGCDEADKPDETSSCGVGDCTFVYSGIGAAQCGYRPVNIGGAPGDICYEEGLSGIYATEKCCCHLITCTLTE